jgi:hypothetical protein
MEEKQGNRFGGRISLEQIEGLMTGLTAKHTAAGDDRQQTNCSK